MKFDRCFYMEGVDGTTDDDGHPLPGREWRCSLHFGHHGAHKMKIWIGYDEEKTTIKVGPPKPPVPANDRKVIIKYYGEIWWTWCPCRSTYKKGDERWVSHECWDDAAEHATICVDTVSREND